ncbi:hypothetical protein PVAND_008544 [Polypedilum vanderplanki]|uniref:Zinc finger protein n=1 Tax=Polypedilum vanderplanki TaxID=319348 RepID=A0A9J6C9X3_POLVA|nr:hypothetical protein PVAND_008544 [Polypedilum vanderplanki]
MSQTGISPSNSIPISAENYQLKWNSHVSNLNSSISSLYKNEKYADVMLFTCNSDEGFCGIPAHKLILGTCSHYFSSIFDNNPTPINTMIYIFLPPELSKRAVATLIQYMYTGEATVANDILNEVLKGGEVLKIRGLCKVNSTSNNTKYTTIDSTHQSQQQHQQLTPAIHSSSTNNYQPYKLIENGTVSTSSPLKSNKSTPRNSIDKAASVHCSTEARNQQHILTQNESPVVVMTSPSSQPNQPQNYAQQSMTNNNQSQHIQQSNNLIIVKKDMAIDPGDASNIPVEHFGLISLKIAAAVKKAQQQQSNLRKSPITTGPPSSSSGYQVDENIRYDTIASPPTFKVYTTSNDIHHQQQQQHMTEDVLRYTEKKKRIAQNQKPSSSTDCIKNSKQFENGQSFQLASSTAIVSHDKNLQQSQQNFPEALSFLTIKEEPIEWSEFDANGIAAQVGDNRTEIITVKPETLEDIENSLSSEVTDKVYSPLTCEVCNLKFQLPSAWVRHIESHSEMNQAQPSVPKKRKKADEEENSENINILSCDLCDNLSFATPAQWVRHVQNTHTETELAISNNSILLKKTNVRQQQQQPKESPVEKPSTCNICKKIFPSYASMLIHKRSHADEKPFACTQLNCNRVFNIKSNLLRHMRTCHNQIPSNENENHDSDSVE